MTIGPSPATLPPATTPEESADSPPIVFFDGVCGLCNRSVDLLITLDRRRRLRFAPLQGETAAERLDADVRELRSIVLVDSSGEARHSTAIVRILRHIGGIWSVASLMLWLVPRPLRDWGYGVIAANRYRLFGKTEACRMPKPGEQELFLP